MKRDSRKTFEIKFKAESQRLEPDAQQARIQSREPEAGARRAAGQCAAACWPFPFPSSLSLSLFFSLSLSPCPSVVIYCVFWIVFLSN